MPHPIFQIAQSESPNRFEPLSNRNSTAFRLPRSVASYQQHLTLSDWPMPPYCPWPHTAMIEPPLDDDPMPRLFSELAVCQQCEIWGIVDASGPGASMTPGDDLWSFGFGLAAWRVAGKSIERKPVYVRRQVAREELDSLMAKITADTIVRIQARIAMQNVLGAPQALLERIIEVNAADAELEDRLAELLEPARFTDDYFGEFTHERVVDVFATSAMWMSDLVTLRLRLSEGVLNLALDVAHQLWNDQIAWDQNIRDCMAKELLPLKSENWLEDDGTTVSREQFESRISVQSVSVDSGGDFEVCYDDGNLFFGHEIVVYGNVRTGMKSAGIQG